MPYRHLPMLLTLVAIAISVPANAASMESDVLVELNFVRAHPRDYADELRRYRSRFDGYVAYDEDGQPQSTHEGTRAVDEAIAFLDRQPALPPLDRAQILVLSAEDQADDQGADGRIGHLSPSGMTISQRAQRRGGGVYVSETISYGQANAHDVVRQLVIDDGVRTRGHRAILFQPWLRFAGVGCGHHAVYGSMCVIDFSQTEDGRPGRSPSR